VEEKEEHECMKGMMEGDKESREGMKDSGHELSALPCGISEHCMGD